MKNDNYLTVTQVAEYLGLTKTEVKQLIEDGKLRPVKAYPNDTRYVLSMREVNKLKL